MLTALVLFAIAALGGVTMAVMRFRGAERPPTALALLHGAFAAAGIIVLIVAMLSTPNPAQARTALVLFIVAALGGFYLFAQHVQKRALPIPVILVHALIAVIGFLVLLVVVIHP
ncbi:MAG TPA: hypothetical protein VGK85_02605 [Myxococcaceae bacterium]|jgi:hypothetical protein